MAEQLIEGASIYAEARCALPDCRSPLHMVLTFSKGIYLTDTAEQLRDPNQAHSSTWHVECAARAASVRAVTTTTRPLMPAASITTWTGCVPS